MISFKNDYSEGACPEVLEALVKTNYEQTIGYGEDAYCEEAKNLIKENINCPNADIYFLVGGTQVNTTVISHCLKPYEAVIASKTGHISIHETGAIEATGHKIIEVEPVDGKLTPDLILNELRKHEDHHMVKPKMVYISNTTEIGTVYTKDELEAISKVCKDNNLLYFLKEDMNFFKEKTCGNSIICGRKTFEGFKIKPLPKRKNIVLTKSDFSFEGISYQTN